MNMNPSRAWDRRRRVGVALLALMAALAVSAMLPRQANAQTSRKSKPAAAKGGDAEDTPKASVGDSKASEAAGPLPPPIEHEMIKLDDGTKVPLRTWNETFAAHEYHQPIDILDKRVRVILDFQRDREPQGPVTALEIDSEGGRLYWCEGGPQIGPGRPTGRVIRSNLDGTRVETLATNRRHPRNLVLDKRSSRIYWLEGAGQSPATLQSATLDGKKERTLSKGLNEPFGLALDSARGQLYYWEHFRLVRVNIEGTQEEVVSTNDHIVRPALEMLSFDSAHDKLYAAFRSFYRWLDRDGTHPAHVPRMDHWANIHGFMFDETHQKIYFLNNTRDLMRANPDGTQVEHLVASPKECADGFARTIEGDVAIDHARGHIYWTGHRSSGSAMYPTISRTDLRPLSKSSKRTAPPLITAITPVEQVAGGHIVLSGDGLTDAIAVAFIDDSNGGHIEATFQAEPEGRLGITVPRLEQGCRRPMIVVRTPSGVTMTLGTDVLAPKRSGAPYQDVRSIDLNGDLNHDVMTSDSTNKPYHHERTVAGPGARVWLRPGIMAGNVEMAVVYAMRGSSLSFGPKGMVTAFAEDDSRVGLPALQSDIETVIYHEPFAVLLRPIYHDKTVKLIPVPAIRPSFPESLFRYHMD